MRPETEEYLREHLGYNDNTIRMLKLVEQKLQLLEEENKTG